MICYRDKTWCSQKCDNKECSVNFTDEDHAKAIVWWGNDNFPLAISDYKTEDCGYKEKKGK